MDAPPGRWQSGWRPVPSRPALPQARHLQPQTPPHPLPLEAVVLRSTYDRANTIVLTLARVPTVEAVNINYGRLDCYDGLPVFCRLVLQTGFAATVFFKAKQQLLCTPPTKFIYRYIHCPVYFITGRAMGKHSKNAGVMGSEALTYHERKALGFGTRKERFGKETMGSFDDCALTLQPVVVRMASRCFSNPSLAHPGPSMHSWWHPIQQGGHCGKPAGAEKGL